MESFKSISIMVVLFLACNAIMVSPSRTLKEVLSPEDTKIVKECESKLSNNSCGEEISTSIYRSDGILTDNCCSNLVAMGQHCHNEMVRISLSMKPEVDPSQVQAKSAQVWDICVEEAISPSPSVPVLSPEDVKILKECESKLSNDSCGAEISTSIYKSDGILTDNCCRNLVAMGQHCHSEMVRISLSMNPEVDPSQVQAKSVQVWDICVAEAISPSPSVPILSLEDVKILKECESKLSNSSCGDEISTSIYKGDGILTDNCCSNLVAMGKYCHNEMLRISLSMKPELDNSQVQAKSAQVWDICVAEAISPSSPVTVPVLSPENIKVLKECESKLSNTT